MKCKIIVDVLKYQIESRFCIGEWCDRKWWVLLQRPKNPPFLFSYTSKMSLKLTNAWMDGWVSHTLSILWKASFLQELVNVSVIPWVHRGVDEEKEDSQSRAVGI